MTISKTYVYKVLLFLDLFICAICFRDPDVTISSETGLAMRRSAPPLWAKCLHWILNSIQANHCEMAIEDDIVRAQNAIRYLQTPQ